MSDRLKSVIQINGGDSENLNLYPRELFIDTNGYLKVGVYGLIANSSDPDNITWSEPDNNTQYAAKDVKAKFSDVSGTTETISTGMFNISDTPDKKKSVTFCNDKLEVSGDGFNLKESINISAKTNKVFNLGNTNFNGGSFNDINSISVKDTISISKDKATLHSTNLYGTTLPTTNLSDGQIFFLIES